MRTPITSAALIALAFLALPACDDAPGFDASLYETDPGEAVVRHLFANLPEIRGDKHIYCIVLGSTPRGSNPTFVKRFEDLGVTFVQSDRLAVRSPDQVPYDPKTELSPIFLQVSTSTDNLKSGDKVDAAWAYKRKFRKLTLTLKQSEGGKWEVIGSELRDESLDGSWKPDWQKG